MRQEAEFRLNKSGPLRSWLTGLLGYGVLLLAVAGLSGCASRMERATEQQAAHDFNCLSEPIKIEKMGFAEYRATGCAKRASYQLVGECYFNWNPCHAVRLSEVELVPPATTKGQ